MIQTIRNSKDKKVAEVDLNTKTVIIKKRECKTTIHFSEDGFLEVGNPPEKIRIPLPVSA